MVKTDILPALELLKTGLAVTTSAMEPLVQNVLAPPNWLLSEVLLRTLAFDSKTIDEKAISACRSLELLDQALSLGEMTPEDSDERNNNLLICDYLYAQAISQVTSIIEPPVIDFLAKAISRSAEDRVTGVERHYRFHLFTAAFDTAWHLGDFPEKCRAAVITAKDRTTENFPKDPTQEYLKRIINLDATE